MMEISKKLIEDRLLDYANLFESTARLIRSGEVNFDYEYMRKIRNLLLLLDTHKFLDTPETTMYLSGEPLGQPTTK
jgi:hypothetical protein